MTDLTFAITINITQGLAALLMAAFFHRFAKLHRRRFLLHWSFAWVMLAICQSCVAMVMSGPPWPGLSTAVSAIGLTAGYLQILGLIAGTVEFGWSRTISFRRHWKPVAGLCFAAVALVVGTTTMDTGPRIMWRFGPRCLIAGSALLALGYAVLRRGRLLGGSGPRAIAICLLLLGLKYLHDALAVSRALPTDDSYNLLAQVVDLVLHVALALSMALWLLEEDRRRLDDSADALERTEAQMRHSQKMEAVGQLAGGIAHDFNNLTMSIQGYAGMVAQSLGQDDPRQEDVGRIRKAARRAASLTRQLLAFSRKQVIRPRVVDLGRVARETRHLLAPLMGADVDIIVRADRDLLRVRTDPGQVEQVLVNLAINARDAMADGGTLSINVRNVHVAEDNALDHAALAPGDYVQLEVSDTGTGIDPAIQGRIFEPFFTTKDPGKGTGLGLATVYGIVKQSGGNIVLDSKRGAGATFRIYFPAVTDAADESISDTPVPWAQNGSATVLLVEDDDLILPLLGRALIEAGHRTLQAHEAQQALSLLERHHGEIDVLVTDLVMPGMSGQELARRATKIIPGLSVIFISGYPEHSGSSDPAPNPEAHYLQKPFAPRRLVEKIASVLAGTPTDDAPTEEQASGGNAVDPA